MEIKSKVLVVEDEKPLAKILENELQASGFNTKYASNGKEAIDLLANEKFDVILLDLLMPVMDGFQVMDELSKRGDRTPVIVITNLGQAEDKAKVTSLGAKEYLIKTDTPMAELIQRVKSFVEENINK